MADFDLADLPPEILTQVTQEAIRRGFMPKPDGYDDAGEPLWSLDAVAAFYGHTPAEGRALLADFQIDNPDRTGYVDPASVHRIN
jgi:hypothetical protein